MGSGKSYAIIIEILKYSNDPLFRCAIFRKHKESLTIAGGLWEELIKTCYYYKIPIKPKQYKLEIEFPSGATARFVHGNHHSPWKFQALLKGLQVTAIYVDEGDEFTSNEIKFLNTRMRSDSDILSYMRITCNPCEGWIKHLVSSYLDENEYPIMGMRGQVKYLFTKGDNLIVEDSKESFRILHGFTDKEISLLRTFTFIPGSVYENKKLLDKNPNYISDLSVLSEHERNRYLLGCWAVLPKEALFKHTDFKSYAGYPKDIFDRFVTIDTAVKFGKDSDYTVASLWGVNPAKKALYLLDMIRARWKYSIARDTIIDWLKGHDPDYCYVEDVTSGSILLQDLRDEFAGKMLTIRGIKRSSRDGKYSRAMKAHSNLHYVDTYLPDDDRDTTNKFLKEVCSFDAEGMDSSSSKVPKKKTHDDITDTWFDAINMVGKNFRRFPVENKRPGYHEVKEIKSRIESGQSIEVIDSGGFYDRF